MIGMFYTYKEIIDQYSNDYQVKKALKNKEITKIKPGLYSKGEAMFEAPEIFVQRQDTVLTLQSAFYYHGVTDYIPESIVVATPRNAYPIKHPSVKQIFMSEKYHSIGVKEVLQDDLKVRVYDLERSLIELIRYEKKVSFEEYFHVLRNFRMKKDAVDFNTLLSYASQFKSAKKIQRVIQNSIL